MEIKKTITVMFNNAKTTSITIEVDDKSDYYWSSFGYIAEVVDSFDLNMLHDNKIKTIKLVRCWLDCDLRTAKNLVDAKIASHYQ